MNSEAIITAIGGRKEAMRLTGLTKGRISQWVVENNIPTPWLKFFHAKFPNLDWPRLLGNAVSTVLVERRRCVRRSTDCKT